jgi:enoyl-CoA hydratase/carnithine racemase
MIEEFPMSSDTTPSVASKTSNGVCTIYINRPESLNALNPDVLKSLLREMQCVERDTSTRVVVIRGSGDKAFVAGADIRSMSGLGAPAIAEYVELGQRTLRAIEQCRVPVIAAVHGFALGGGLELALACDLIVCATSARIGQPEVSLGIIPGFGGTQRLIQRCGIGRARRLCYTGELVSAEEGFSLGIVDKVVSDESFNEAIAEMTQQIISKAPLAVQGAKRVILRSQEQALLAGLQLEVEEFLRLFATADREEGMSAFIEKRKPSFTGR